MTRLPVAPAFVDRFGPETRMALDFEGTERATARDPLTVSALNRAVAGLLERSFPLVRVRGEVANLTRAASGHWYFALKDDQAQVRCVMFRSRNLALGWVPREGDDVELSAVVSLYEARGEFQLTVESMRRAGQGRLFEEFMRLKAKLAAEGLFDTDAKRPLPATPRRVGVVTSLQAAALRDVLTCLARRAPYVSVVVYPVPVQGAGAGQRIATMLATVSARAEVDVVLLVRGGGSIEDLWAFNDENVARTIIRSPVPVISGVGHEVDFTIADFVADLRAPTPSAAAELITPDQTETRSLLRGFADSLAAVVTARLQNNRLQLNSQLRGLQHLSPRVKLANARQRIDDVLASLQESMAHDLELQREKISSMSAQLNALNPLNVLARGYAVVRIEPSGEIVRSRKQVKPETQLSIRVSDGEFEAKSEGRGMKNEENR